MRILIYTLHFEPEPIGIGKYTGEMAAWLAQRGHEVRVLTAPPFYPHWRVGQGYSAIRYSREIRNSVLVQRCPVWVPRKPTGIGRVIHLFIFALTSGIAAIAQLTWRPGVVLTVTPSLVYCPAALLVARLSRACAWLHIQDFEIDAAFATGQLRRAFLKRFAGQCERWLIGRFDKISTISQSMLRRLKEKGIGEAKRVHFPNWVDMEAIRPLDSPQFFRRQLGIDKDAIVVLYSGTIGVKQGLQFMLDAADRLSQRSKITFVICGDGAEKSRYQETYASLPNLKWLPLQPEETLNELLNTSDIHLLPQLAAVADAVMPSKLTGMLASGRPVIATANPGTELWQVVSQCGVVVPPGDVNSLCDAILTLSADEEARKRLGVKARQYAAAHMERSQVLLEFEQALIRGYNAPYAT